MPITLPKLSRRQFVKRALMAGAGLAGFSAPESFAGLFGKSRDRHTFVFFSDSHIAADVTLKSSGVNMADNLAACIREVAARATSPAAVIVNGDLAFKLGLAEDYAAFGKLIGPVRALAPLHLTLGNHDGRDNFWQAFPHDAERQKAVPQKQCAVLRSVHANWFLLDSLDATNSTPGELGGKQLDWLEHRLDSLGDKPAILVAHHNLNRQDGISGLKDSALLEELFARHRHVKAFVFGHTHNWQVETHSSGVHLINLPPTGYAFKPDRPSGWVRCALSANGAEFELRALDIHHPEHAQVKHLKWRT